MIERAEIIPLRRRVAHFAASATGCHPLGKLASMRVSVARRTRKVRKVIGRCLPRRRTLVTFATRNGFVSARQFESQLLVFCQRE